jgi:hypothetical protein
MADPWIVSDTLEHRPHVHTQIFRESGDLVRERESQGEEWFALGDTTRLELNLCDLMVTHALVGWR